MSKFPLSCTVPLRDKQTIKCVLNSLTKRSQRVGTFSAIMHLETLFSSTCFAFVIHFVTSRLLSFVHFLNRLKGCFELMDVIYYKTLLRLKCDFISIFAHIPVNQGTIKYCNK